MKYRRNADTDLQSLKRAALADPGDEQAQLRYQHALARAEGHKPTCSYIRYHLAYEKDAEAYQKEIDAFTAQWPDYCAACDAWGGRYSSYDPSPAGVGLSAGYMMEYDPCSECVEEEKCPRCGGYCPLHETEKDDYSACTVCGWDERNKLPGLSPEPPYPAECDCWEDELKDLWD